MPSYGNTVKAYRVDIEINGVAVEIEAGKYGYF